MERTGTRDGVDGDGRRKAISCRCIKGNGAGPTLPTLGPCKCALQRIGRRAATASVDSPTIRDFMCSPLELGEVSPNGHREPNQT